MNKNKGIIGIGLIVAIVIGIIVVGGGAYYLGESRVKQEVKSPKNVLPNNENNNLPANNNKQVNVPTTHSSSITILSPNGGEKFATSTTNQQIPITWKSSGIVSQNVAIYVKNISTGNEALSLVASDSGSTNISGIPAGIYKIRICSTNQKNGNFEVSYDPDCATASDYSDNSFTINSAPAKTISTTDWKTYTNTGCGYSFQYPDSWSQLGSQSNAIDRNGVVLSRLVDFMDTASQGIERSDGSNNQIYAPKDNMHIECYTMGTAVYNDELSRYNNSSDIFAQTKKTITVGGQTAIVGEMKNTATISGGEHPGRTVIPSHNMYVFFLHKDQTHSLYFEFDTPLGGNDTVEIANFEKLLTTFKFN